MFVAGDLETITRVRPVGRDEFGDPVAGSATELEIPGCLFAPGGAAENGSRFGQPNIGSNQTEADATIYAPPGADVLATDRIVARGRTFEVIGFPLAWGTSGVEIPLHVVEG